MDGVLFRMDDPLPGASDAVNRCRRRGERVWFLTNNSSRTREDYVSKLAKFGIQASAEEIVTSAWAAGRRLAEWGAKGSRVLVIGEQGLRSELTAAGMHVVDRAEDAPQYVVVGWDRGLTYDKLAQAHLAVCAGARFIATNRDATYPDAGGRTLPGGGSIVAALAASTGVEPPVIGKPDPYCLELILQLSSCPPRQAMMVGDRLDTDIALGKRLGTQTGLVLTGVTSAAEAADAPDSLRPDFIWPDLTTFP
jgi:phosphoglycolate/pyridoxal phosphate phosphatase family enzyme